MASPAIPSIISLFPSFGYTAGPTVPNGAELSLLAQYTVGVDAAVVAHAGGTQALGLQLPPAPPFVQIGTCATTGDSVILPPAIPGNFVFLVNQGAQTLDIYGIASNPQNGGAGDQIYPVNNATANSNATALTLAATHSTILICYVLGLWVQFFAS